MPILATLMAVPEEPVYGDEARTYLAEFVRWLNEFLSSISDSTDERDSNGDRLFEPGQIDFLSAALRETAEQFSQAERGAGNLSDAALVDYGLQGTQLQWKLSNITHWMQRFFSERTKELLDRLLSSIDALLKSLLGAIGAGDALEELKEAVRNSMALIPQADK